MEEAMCGGQGLGQGPLAGGLAQGHEAGAGSQSQARSRSRS